MRKSLSDLLMSAPMPPSAPACITWLSLRPEPLPTLRHTRHQPGPLALQLPEPFPGIACIAFGIGPGGARWLGRLAASDWFTGLVPQPADIAAAGGAPPNGSQSTLFGVAWPNAHLAAVAITADAGQAEHAAAVALVTALRAQPAVQGCRMVVVVTFDSVDPAAEAIEVALRRQGALVIRPGLGADGDHLHHLPLRAATYPRRGRLVGVDLADYLATWCPGGRADLYVMPAPLADARPMINELQRAPGQITALNLDLHFDPDDPNNPVVAIDQLATCCREHLLPREDAPFVFTTSERLDGTTGTFDLLLIERPLSESET